MKRAYILPIKQFSYAAILLLLGCGMTPQNQPLSAFSSQNEGFNYLNRGVVEDWSTHHVVFSNPGTLEDAIKNGRREEWERIVSDPRYRMQWVKRYGASSGLTEDGADVLQAPSKVELPVGVFQKRWKEKKGFEKAPLHGDWAVALSGGGNFSVPIDVYPAKYTFTPIGSPSCTSDFVVYPINTAGNSSNQANLLGVNNLYASPTCSGTIPTVLFSYFVGTGTIQTSPVLSEDGTKVAFVESITGTLLAGSKFHVLKLDKSGNSGCPSSTPCNGTAFGSPVAPGTHNSASDVSITLSGSLVGLFGVSVTRSSPFVDYQNDNAYIGDDSGQLHKIHPVFQGTPAEVTTGGWPFLVASGVILTGPVFDGGTSQNIFVGGSKGNLFCVTSAAAACSTASISVASGTTPGPVVDEPIVDSTNQKVFAAASNSTNSVLLQVTTSLGSPLRVNAGINSTDLYDGAFDNAYITSANGTGNMYFCGNLPSVATPELYQVSISGGTMSTATQVFQLVLSGNSGTTVDCGPLTEIFNGSQDLLFVDVLDHGFNTGTTNCNNQTCIMSFILPTSSPFTFPSAATATATNVTLSLGNHGISGMIIDNVSGTTGASQIYFGNLQQSTAVQASQSALR